MYEMRLTKLSESCATYDGPVLAAQAEQRDEKRLDNCDLGSAALSVAAVLQRHVD
jgi:hypothetical protein